MPKKWKWIVGLGVVLLFGVIAYSLFEASQHRYEVCVSFRGRSHCATAAGRTPEEAIHSAHEIDCALLSVDRDDNIVCLGVPPSSVRALSGK